METLPRKTEPAGDGQSTGPGLTGRAIQEAVSRALAEDLGSDGDITTDSLIEPRQTCTGAFVAQEPMVVAGQQVAAAVFAQLSPQVVYEAATEDGGRLEAGDTVARISGPAAAILIGERTALNFLQRLSGVATGAATAASAVAGSGVMLLDSRKTTPGLRLLEKYAVRVGGVRNHRFGLDDGILIKDNHIAFYGSPAEAVRRLRESYRGQCPVEVEIDHLGDLDEVLLSGADLVLLDNFDIEEVRQAVERTRRAVPLEASGGITMATLADYAATGVDRISLGFLTHSAPAVGISLGIHGQDGP